MELQVQGLTRKLPCAFRSLSFGGARAGYAAAYFPLANLRATAIARTNDGGNTWTLSKPDGMDAEPEQIFFWNDNTGIVLLRDKKSLMTMDGGETWKGIIAPFSDPRVHVAMGGGKFGVGLLYNTAYYSTNGGRSFSSRAFPVPANPNAVTFPDAQHGYTVGLHGMVYRYRIVPIAYNVPGMIGAPAAE
jgi:photosystem II stability/assembly factor-like uncharacterized protein